MDDLQKISNSKFCKVGKCQPRKWLQKRVSLHKLVEWIPTVYLYSCQWLSLEILDIIDHLID